MSARTIARGALGLACVALVVASAWTIAPEHLEAEVLLLRWRARRLARQRGWGWGWAG